MIEKSSKKHPEYFSLAGKLRTHDAKLLNISPVGQGAEKKNRVIAQINFKDKYKQVSLFERVYEENSGAAEHYQTVWKAFQKAGLPVVSSLYISPEMPGHLYLTDMTAQGGKFYGKGLLEEIQDDPRLILKRPDENDTLFLQLMQQQLSALLEQASNYERLATEANLLLPSDDPFEVLVTPEGTWKLIILDLTSAALAEKTHLTKDQVERKNKTSLQFFYSIINKIQKSLENPTLEFFRQLIKNHLHR